MGRVDGLIIPRSYNDYFSRSDPQAIREIVATYTDDELDTTSELPVQNKVIAELVPSGAAANNKLATAADVTPKQKARLNNGIRKSNTTRPTGHNGN